VDLIGQVVAWFTDPGNWSGSSGIPNRTLEHVVLSAAAIITAIVVAVPVWPVSRSATPGRVRS
jgi:osmoprotectant transport system permease protein